MRMAEMVSMGVGNKAFRDIAPNEEAISDRTINYVLKCRGSLVGGVRKAAREATRTSVSPSLRSPQDLGPGGLSPVLT